MGDFSSLTKAQMEVEYLNGYKDGLLIRDRQEEFLRVTNISTMQSQIWGWLARKEYRRLFDHPWRYH